MKRVLLFAVIAALSVVGLAQAAGGPITKQNGSSPVLTFTSICAVSGYANYGFCGGDVTKFTDVAGRMNAIQAKPGRYNLDFSFANLTPGTEYRLWSTRDAFTWVEVGRAFADEFGSVAYTLQTNSPAGLGFDLNTVSGDTTIMSSWWSGKKLVVNGDTTLSPSV